MINFFIVLIMLPISTLLFAQGQGEVVQLANKAFKEVQDINNDAYSKGAAT